MRFDKVYLYYVPDSDEPGKLFPLLKEGNVLLHRRSVYELGACEDLVVFTGQASTPCIVDVENQQTYIGMDAVTEWIAAHSE